MPDRAHGNHLSAENVLSPTATAEAQDLEKSARPITAGGVEGAHTLVHIAPDLTYCRLHVQSFSGGSRALVRTKTASRRRTPVPADISPSDAFGSTKREASGEDECGTETAALHSSQSSGWLAACRR